MERLKYIPERGRKHALRVYRLHFSGVEIYPREGTETRMAKLQFHNPVPLKFIPARGRKLKATIYITALCKVKTYPREGTETC